MAFSFVQDDTPGPPGLNTKGAWDNTITYYSRDLVRFNGSAWVAQKLNVNVAPSTLFPDTWQLLVEKGNSESNLSYKGGWSGTLNYFKNDVVFYNSSSYVALLNNINKQPTTEPSIWQILVSGGSGDNSSTIIDGGFY